MANKRKNKKQRYFPDVKIVENLQVSKELETTVKHKNSMFDHFGLWQFSRRVRYCDSTGKWLAKVTTQRENRIGLDWRQR